MAAAAMVDSPHGAAQLPLRLRHSSSPPDAAPAYLHRTLSCYYTLLPSACPRRKARPTAHAPLKHPAGDLICRAIEPHPVAHRDRVPISALPLLPTGKGDYRSSSKTAMPPPRRDWFPNLPSVALSADSSSWARRHAIASRNPRPATPSGMKEMGGKNTPAEARSGR